MIYAAVYETVGAALAEMIGQYDAAVVDKEDGKPRVVKRMDRPHIRVIPEWFEGGTVPRKELHEAAEQLTANQAGLVAVGEPTIEEALDQALAKAAKVVKHTMEATADGVMSHDCITWSLMSAPCRGNYGIRPVPSKGIPIRACLRRVWLTYPFPPPFSLGG